MNSLYCQSCLEDITFKKPFFTSDSQKVVCELCYSKNQLIYWKSRVTKLKILVEARK